MGRCRSRDGRRNPRQEASCAGSQADLDGRDARLGSHDPFGNPELSPDLSYSRRIRRAADGLRVWKLGDDNWAISSMIPPTSDQPTQARPQSRRGRCRWIPQLAMSRYCRIADIADRMEPFSTGRSIGRWTCRATSLVAADREFHVRSIDLARANGLASRPISANGVTGILSGERSLLSKLAEVQHGIAASDLPAG